MKKQRSSAAVNSSLIRRPIQRMFPIFLLPTFLAFCIGFLWPFLHGIYLSFCKFTITSNAKWIGFDNYVKAFQDPGFLHAFWYTALVAVTSLVIINLGAFAVAYALTRGIKGSNVFRGVFFMPNLIGGIVLGYIWSTIFDGFLAKYGTSIVLDSRLGYWGLMIMLSWQQIGYMMIIYIAGLQSVSEDMLEAAQIDGANGWHTLWHITIRTFLSLTNGFKLFDQNLVLTGGQPFTFQADGTVIRTTEMLALNIYNTFYLNSKSRGVGQAKAVLFFILVAAIALIQLRATKSKEVQQ